MPSNILKIESLTHQNIKLKRTDNKGQVYLECPSMVEPFLLRCTVESSEPRLWVERDLEGHHASMMVFDPHHFPQPEEVPTTSLGHDILFILDQSASMGESMRMFKAKTLVQQCLGCLRETDYFNILGFGATMNRFSPSSVPAKPKQVAEGRRFNDSLFSTLGSTQLSQVLTWVAEVHRDPEILQSIILFTDGEVSDEQELLQLLTHLRHTSPWIRLFIFGIGKQSTFHFLTSLARTGGGVAECSEQKLPSQERVTKMMDLAHQPSFHDLSIKWNSSCEAITQAPTRLNSLFLCETLTAFAFAGSCTQATLSVSNGPHRDAYTIYTPELCFRKGSIIHKLAAQAFIQNWVDGSYNPDTVLHELQREAKEEEITELG